MSEVSNDQILDDRFIHKSEVLKVCGMSAATLHRWEKDGQFPRGIRLSSRNVVWSQSEVENWMEERKEARNV